MTRPGACATVTRAVGASLTYALPVHPADATRHVMLLVRVWAMLDPTAVVHDATGTPVAHVPAQPLPAP